MLRYATSKKNNDGKCTTDTLEGLVTSGKLTESEMDEIIETYP